jgi:flagellar biosynthesis component FlhA
MKLLGISSGKIASVAFLLVTLFLALFLSGMDFLKTSNVAEVPVFQEGHEGMKKEEEKKEGMEEEEEEEEKKEGMEEEEEKTEGLEEEEEDAVEGFEVGRQHLPFSSLAEAFTMLDAKKK